MNHDGDTSQEGIDHGAMGHAAMGHGAADHAAHQVAPVSPAKASHHSSMNHGSMDHGAIAPYIGVVHERAFGSTADFRRAEGEDTRDTRLVAGVRIWP